MAVVANRFGTPEQRAEYYRQQGRPDAAAAVMGQPIPPSAGGAAQPAQAAPTPVSDIAEQGAKVYDPLMGLSEAARSFYEQMARSQAAGFERAATGQEQVQQAGLGALEAQQALAGLLGPEAQQAAIAQLEASPQFQALVGQGEQAILANAAATGGVRGGNTQAALAQFRPQVLSGLINQQYQNLMGLSGMGAQAGQGLLGQRAGMAGLGAGEQRGYTGMGADLALGQASTLMGGQLGQIEFDLAQQAREEEQRRYDAEIGAQNLRTVLGVAMPFAKLFMPTP